MTARALAIAVLAVALSCAAQHPMTAGAPPPNAATLPASNDPHGEIEQLSQQIDAQSAPLHLAAPAVQAMAVAPPSTQDAACHPAPSDTCHDSCTAADSICSNAKRICNLADQLAGDSWAAGKCQGARTTCQAAHERCCGCS